jgi:hypothetical protein
VRKINTLENWGGLMPKEQKVQECPSLPQGKLARDDDSSTTAGKIKIN